MKLLLALTLSLFTVALCDSFRPNGAIPTDLQDHTKLDDLRYFFRNLYDQFNLSEPHGISNCFDEKSAGLFFKSLYEVHRLLNDTKERNQIALHFDYAKLVVLFYQLKVPYSCASQTQDFYDLLDALEVDEKDINELMVIKYIYFQARFSSLLNDYVPLIKGLENNNNRKAGVAYARMLSNMVEVVKYRGIFFLSNQAFENGVAVKLDLNYPSKSIRCFDDFSARDWLQILYGLSESVSNGTWKDAPINTRVYWKEYGRDLMEGIPKSVFECINNSEEHREIVEKLGVEIWDRAFVDLMLRYVNNNRLEYYLLMKGMKESFDSFNLNHAGSIYAKWIKKIAKSKNNETGSEIAEDIVV